MCQSMRESIGNYTHFIGKEYEMCGLSMISNIPTNVSKCFEYNHEISDLADAREVRTGEIPWFVPIEVRRKNRYGLISYSK